MSIAETAPSLVELEAGAVTAARSAGRVIREAFGGVDLAAERAIVETLEERFPHCKILVSDYEDRPFDLMRPDQIVASNARIHSEMVEVLRQVRQDRCP